MIRTINNQAAKSSVDGIVKKVSSREFLRISESGKPKIIDSKFVPPIMGKEGDFGKFVIRIK